MHPSSLIRVFAVRMKKAWVLTFPFSAQRSLWSDRADAQADLSLPWAHTHFVGFVMSWLKWTHQIGKDRGSSWLGEKNRLIYLAVHISLTSIFLGDTNSTPRSQEQVIFSQLYTRQSISVTGRGSSEIISRILWSYVMILSTGIYRSGQTAETQISSLISLHSLDIMMFFEQIPRQ